MRKDIPRIFVNKIGKINNNKEVYYSFKDKDVEYKKVDLYDIQRKIDEIFRSNDFIYKKKMHIKTKYDEKDYVIISKSVDYLLSIDGDKIYIDNILDIY